MSKKKRAFYLVVVAVLGQVFYMWLNLSLPFGVVGKLLGY